MDLILIVHSFHLTTRINTSSLSIFNTYTSHNPKSFFHHHQNSLATGLYPWPPKLAGKPHQNATRNPPFLSPPRRKPLKSQIPYHSKFLLLKTLSRRPSFPFWQSLAGKNPKLLSSFHLQRTVTPYPTPSSLILSRLLANPHATDPSWTIQIFFKKTAP